MSRVYKHNPSNRTKKRFVSRREALCVGKVVDGKCQCCGMFLTRNVPHKPRYDGQFGYVLTYSDGSTYTTKPGEAH